MCSSPRAEGLFFLILDHRRFIREDSCHFVAHPVFRCLFQAHRPGCWLGSRPDEKDLGFVGDEAMLGWERPMDLRMGLERRIGGYIENKEVADARF